MSNELMLLAELLVVYALILVFWRVWGKVGLVCWLGIATILANIEVLILVDAFTLEQTLGNILFASTFIATDILSENTDEKFTKKAVNLSIMTSVVFIVISQMWLLYTPNANDWASPSFHTLFSNTPRLLLSGLVVFAIVQRLDIWLYHKWWSFTAKRGDAHAFLWLRNNGSTLISQLVNAFLYNFLAFGGMYELPTLISICLSSYLVFLVMALLDTPIVYIARLWHEKYKID